MPILLLVILIHKSPVRLTGESELQFSDIFCSIFILIQLTGCQCFIDSVVRLIEQYLKENNLMKTLILLQVKVFFGFIKVILCKFRCYILYH